VVGSLIYSLLRVLLDALATSHGDQAGLQAEVLALRRQVQVLQRQIDRVRWSPGDRMVLAALRERIPRSGWAGLLVNRRRCSAGTRRWYEGSGRPTEADRAVAGRPSQGNAAS
jgi:hypothetical protein